MVIERVVPCTFLLRTYRPLTDSSLEISLETKNHPWHLQFCNIFTALHHGRNHSPKNFTASPITTLNETVIMRVVLALIDVVMISNLLIMVIVGEYETFVSRLNLEGHRDQPEWLNHVNASVLKVKLATATIGISSIHLLKTFINADNYTDRVLIAQMAIDIGHSRPKALSGRYLGKMCR